MEALEKSRLKFWDVQTMEDFRAQFYFSIAATSFLQFYFCIATTHTFWKTTLATTSS